MGKGFEGFEGKLHAFFPRILSRQNNRNWPTEWNWSSLALVVDICAQRWFNLRLTPLRDTIPSINPDYILLEESTALLANCCDAGVVKAPSTMLPSTFGPPSWKVQTILLIFFVEGQTHTFSARSHLRLLTSTLWGEAEGEGGELYLILFPDM